MQRTMWTLETSLKRFDRGRMLASGLEIFSCDSLAKNVAAFCLCPKNAFEAKLKNLEQMLLAQRTLR